MRVIFAICFVSFFPLLVSAQSSEDKELVTSFSDKAFAAYDVGDIEGAIVFLEQAHELIRTSWVDDDLETAEVKGNLAHLYHTTGRLDLAEPLYLQFLNTKERLLGSRHPELAFYLNNLALLYTDTQRYEDAENHFLNAAEVLRASRGPEDPETLTAWNNLADLYITMGRLADAQRLLVRVKDTRARVLGPEHPSTILSSGNLATLYADMG